MILCFFWYIRPTEPTLYKRDVINLSRIWFLHLFIQILTYIAIHYQQKISVMQISTTLYTQYFNSRTLTCVLYHLNRDALKWNPITIKILMYEENLYLFSKIQNRFRQSYTTTRSNGAQYIDLHDEWISYHLKIYHGLSLVDPLFIWLSIYETFMYAFEIVIVRNGFFMYTESMRLIKLFMDSVKLKF